MNAVDTAVSLWTDGSRVTVPLNVVPSVRLPEMAKIVGAAFALASPNKQRRTSSLLCFKKFDIAVICLILVDPSSRSDIYHATGRRPVGMCPKHYLFHLESEPTSKGLN
jgi:hypothetical protein